MLGYIFLVENAVTGRKYIGKNLSVSFNKHYFGDNQELLNDIRNLGESKFSIKMLKAVETVKECEPVYKSILSEYGALTDKNFYNFTDEVTDKPKKRTRKKKVEE